MMNQLKLYDVVPEGWMQNGLFISAIQGNWTEDETVNTNNLDFAYLYGHSGQKYISPFLETFLDENGKLTQQAVTNIGAILFQLFGENWNRLWEVNKAEYDPIMNYDKHEESDTDESGKETEDITHTGQDTNVSVGLSADNASNNKVYGFNSSTPVNASEGSQSHKNTDTFTKGISDKIEKSFTDRNTHYENHTYGNIGVVSAQQMQLQSLEVWKWKFWMQVMEDIDSWLCLTIY